MSFPPRLPTPLRRFLLGQQVFWAARVALGASLPCLLILTWNGGQTAALAAGVGALYVGLLDLPGTARTRHRTLLLAALLLTGATALACVLMRSAAGVWLTLFLISAIGGYAMNFGVRAGIMGLNGVLALALALSLRQAPAATVEAYLAGLAGGALWYVYYSLAVCAWLRFSMHRRALADELFALAGQFRARARCYDPQAAEGEALAALVHSQRLQQERHQLTRDLVLGELAALRGHTRTPDHLRLFNLFADCVALYDLVLGAYTDFTLLRQHPACHPLLAAIRDRLEHGAATLEDIAGAVALGRSLRARPMHAREPADLRARLAAMALQLPAEVIATLGDSLDRLERMRRQIAHTVRDLKSGRNTSGLKIEQVLGFYPADTPLFTPPPPGGWLSGPALAYAERLALAMLVALCAATLRDDAHGYWIVLTVAVSLRPGFGQSRQRGLKRIQGTLLGCAAALPVLTLGFAPQWLFALAVLSLMLSLALAAMDYLASSFFGALMIVLAYHLIAPGAHIVGARVLDTLIGGAIAWSMARVLPYWESRQIAPRCQALRAALIAYLERLQTLAPDTEIAYRAARREARAALSALGASIDGMRQDPPQTRLHTPALGSLVRLADLLLSIGESRAALSRLSSVRDWSEECRLAGAILANQPGGPPMLDRQTEVSLIECAWHLRLACESVCAARPGIAATQAPEA